MINRFQEIINSEIESLEFPQKPENLYEPIKYILSIGGKRLRPLLALISNDLYEKNIEDIIFPAIGLEIFHNFTLLHDDIMDKAEIRRNKQTVHKKWNENIAILSGDAMMFIANNLMLKTNQKFIKEILLLFNKTAIEVCEGQQFDMNFEESLDVSENEYIEMIRLKTSVLIATALKFGAIIGNATQEDADLIYNYGINIGLAFQLQDDLLDTYGNVEVFGKKIGGDIVSNKKTFLLISALNNSNKKDKSELLNLLKGTFENDLKIEKVKSIYDKYQVKQITEEKIENYFVEAKNILDKISIKDKNVLNNFIENLRNRKF